MNHNKNCNCMKFHEISRCSFEMMWVRNARRLRPPRTKYPPIGVLRFLRLFAHRRRQHVQIVQHQHGRLSLQRTVEDRAQVAFDRLGLCVCVYGNNPLVMRARCGCQPALCAFRTLANHLAACQPECALQPASKCTRVCVTRPQIPGLVQVRAMRGADRAAVVRTFLPLYMRQSTIVV